MRSLTEIERALRDNPTQYALFQEIEDALEQDWGEKVNQLECDLDEAYSQGWHDARNVGGDLTGDPSGTPGSNDTAQTRIRNVRDMREWLRPIASELRLITNDTLNCTRTVSERIGFRDRIYNLERRIQQRVTDLAKRVPHDPDKKGAPS